MLEEFGVKNQVYLSSSSNHHYLTFSLNSRWQGGSAVVSKCTGWMSETKFHHHGDIWLQHPVGVLWLKAAQNLQVVLVTSGRWKE